MKPKRILIVAIIIYVIGLIMSSCSPMQRMNRLIKNHPELVRVDTIHIIDTLIVQSYNYDTTTLFVQHKTVEVVNNEKLKLVYFYDTLTKEIHHSVICKGDTIIREIQVPFEKVVVEKQWGKSVFNYFLAALVLLIIVLIVRFLYKFVL